MVKTSSSAFDISAYNISAMININVTYKLVRALCSKCKNALDFKEFLGDFNDRSYIIGGCGNCNKNFLVVFKYNEKEKRRKKK